MFFVSTVAPSGNRYFRCLVQNRFSVRNSETICLWYNIQCVLLHRTEFSTSFVMNIKGKCTVNSPFIALDVALIINSRELLSGSLIIVECFNLVLIYRGFFVLCSIFIFSVHKTLFLHTFLTAVIMMYYAVVIITAYFFFFFLLMCWNSFNSWSAQPVARGQSVACELHSYFACSDIWI
jgi:hypothetical protein